MSFVSFLVCIYIWYDMIWYDMIYDTIRHDMIWYIFVNCNWVVTRWQYYSTRLHRDNTYISARDINPLILTEGKYTFFVVGSNFSSIMYRYMNLRLEIFSIGLPSIELATILSRTLTSSVSFTYVIHHLHIYVQILCTLFRGKFCLVYSICAYVCTARTCCLV